MQSYKKHSKKASASMKMKKSSKKSYGGKQLQSDLKALEMLLGGFQEGGKTEYNRYFTVHTISGKPAKDILKDKTGRYGMAKSSGPLGAAKKAYTEILRKVGKNSGSSEVIFEIRETTSSSVKKVYGPYIGIREKIPDAIRKKDKFLMKHKITHRSSVHLLGKKNAKIGGMKYKSAKKASMKASMMKKQKASMKKGGDFWSFFN